MGCVHPKASTLSSRGAMERFKLENGYVKGQYVGARRSNGQRVLGKQSGRLFRPYVTNNEDGFGIVGGRPSVGGRGGQEKKLVTKEKGGDGGGGGEGNASQRPAKPSFDDELVGGWPKWLTDNIPRQVLAGLVPRSAESYDKLDKIGEGTYSNVYKACDKETGKIVALKKVRFDTSEPESVKFMAREIMILQKLDHPNVVKLEGLATSRMQYSLYLVFDFMQSDLGRIIARPDEKLTESQIKCYMQQLLSGLQHCHERGILHRDIKGSNLLIDKSGILKIADFGLANYFDPERRRPLTSKVVTLWYRAPELLLGATDYGTGIDLWSAGCLMAEMFAGRPIMPGRTEVEQLHRIFKLCGTPSEDFWRRLKAPTTFRPLHTYRPNLREAFKEFPASSLGLFKNLLALDPAHRGSAASALKNEFFYTSPLACDLSGLPVIYIEEEEPAQTNERRKHRRSRTKKERRRRNQDNEKTGDDSSSKQEQEKSAEPKVLSQEPNSSTTPSAKGTTLGVSPAVLASPSALPLRKMSARSESHPNVTKNIKNFPPLSDAKRTDLKYKNGNRLDHVQRSVSTRERDFRELDQRDLHQLHALDR